MESQSRISWKKRPRQRKNPAAKPPERKKRISNPDSKRQLKNILKHLSINRNIMPYGRCSVFCRTLRHIVKSRIVNSKLPQSRDKSKRFEKQLKAASKVQDLFPVSHHIRISAEYPYRKLRRLERSLVRHVFQPRKSDYRHSLTVSYPVLR